jgi:hypothetical protein
LHRRGGRLRAFRPAHLGQYVFCVHHALVAETDVKFDGGMYSFADMLVSSSRASLRPRPFTRGSSVD